VANLSATVEPLAIGGLGRLYMAAILGPGGSSIAAKIQ